MEKIGYLGPEGSYSFIAAKALRPNAELIARSGFPAVFALLASGEADGAVVPIENSLNGGVMQNIDLLQYSENICATEEYTVKIDHRLVTLVGADLSGIKCIYSHAQALEQCAGYLYKNFPSARLISTGSTAASLDMVKDSTDAAIAGAHTKRAGLVLSPENIADEENNFTHFLLLRRGAVPVSPSRRIFFSAECPNKSGALLTLLNLISAHGINMTKLQSRPIKNRPEQYRFFIEIEGDYSSAATRAALKEIAGSVAAFKLLGCY